MDGLYPLLYYKNRYLFSLKNQNEENSKSLFVLNDQNELETLGGRNINNVSINDSMMAFQDSHDGMIYFLSLDNLKLVKSIHIGNSGLDFEGFTIRGDMLWIVIQDNIAQKTIYQKRRRNNQK